MTKEELSQQLDEKIEKIDIPLTEKITKEEYESVLEKMLNDISSELKELVYEYETLTDVYKKYQSDQWKYNLTFYKDETEISYTKNIKKKMGFNI